MHTVSEPEGLGCSKAGTAASATNSRRFTLLLFFAAHYAIVRIADVRETWDRRIGRADDLATADSPAAPLLAFYARLLRNQKAVYDALNARRPSGSLDRDLTLMSEPVSRLLREVAANGPEQLANQARTLDLESLRNPVMAHWREPSDHQFFPKAILQPYADWLAESGVRPIDRVLTLPGGGPGRPASNRCPFCGGAPQLSILDPVSATSGDGGGRRLLCATCLSTWPFRRVLCAQCGEEDERKLGYFHSPDYDHLRIDACERCRRYLKTVDLGRLGLAVPLVDEVAGASLDIWARDHGYEKIELNLVGL
jgi:FdhE protein